MNCAAAKLTVFCGLALLAGAAAAQSITGVGFLDGGNRSVAYGMSPDGVAVVGWGTSSSGNHAFRWTRAGGISDLGPMPGGSDSFAFAASNGGAVVVGYGDTSTGTLAWHWTAEEGMQTLGTLGGNLSYARAVSPDGTIIVGGSSPVTTSTNLRVFRWTQDTGMQNLGGLVPGNYYSMAEGISADGTVITGLSDNSFGFRAFRWTAAGGMVDLGWQNGWPTQGWNISGDGNTVVGYGGSVNGSLCNRWTQGTGIQPLGVLDGFVYSYNYAANQDGSKIVGSSGLGNPGYYHAHMWTQATGLVDLNTYLPQVGVGLSGWDLNVAHSISADGNFIAGEGMHNGLPESWIVSLLPTCGSADFNCDGDVATDADIEAFFACVAGSCPPPPCTSTADFNGDGDSGTDADIESFFRVLAGGSC
jgi:probable HAF family extracellular repeat protein